MAGRKRKPSRAATYGRGSIYTDKAGRVYFTPPPLDGVRQRRIRCVDTAHAQVVRETYERELAQKRAAGLDLRGGALPLHEWLPIWFDTYRQPNIAATFAAQDRQHIRMYILGLLPNIAIDKLHSDALTRWRNQLVAQISPHTARRAVSLLTLALDQAVASGRILRNPAAAIPPIDVTTAQKHRNDLLTDAQLATVLHRLRMAERRRLFWIMSLLGLRRGEALGLLLSDLDDAAQSVAVSGQIQEIDATIVRLDHAKTSSSERTIYLPDAVYAVLLAQRADVRRRQLATPGWHDGGYLFPSATGAAQVPNSLNAFFRYHTRTAIQQSATLHSLRHMAVTRFDVLGVRRVVRKKIVGHTLDTHERYSHVSADDMRSAIALAHEAICAAGATPDKRKTG